jgi:hypothetical protein
MTGTSHEELCTLMITSRWILLRMRSVLDTSCEHNRKHILFSITFSKNRAVYEKM